MNYAVLASDGSSTNAMEAVMRGVVDVIEFSGTIVNHLVSNPIYLFLLASGFVGVGVAIFTTLKRGATS